MSQSFRVDNLPMLRRSQAAGKGKEVLLRQEVSPDSTLKLERRTGSVRVARYGRALGAVVDGNAAEGRWFKEASISLATGFTLGFSLRAGDILEATGSLPLVTLERSDGDMAQVLLIRDSAGLKLQMSATEGGGSTLSSNSGTLSALDEIHVALRYDPTTGELELDTSGDLTTDLALSISALTLGGTAYSLHVLGDPLQTSAKPLHRSCVISNLVRYTTRVADVTDFLNTRTPSGSPVDHFKLTGRTGLLGGNLGSSSKPLLAHPAPPQLGSGLLHFNGTSSAERVELVSEVEQLFATNTRSVADTGFTFYLKGTREKLGTGEEVILHFGDLAKLVIVATSGLVQFSYNGTDIITTTAAIAAEQAYEIWFGRDGNTLQLKVVASSTETVSTSSNDLLAPTLDFSRIPKLWIGSDEDDTLDTKYGGSLEIVALFKEPVLFNPGTGPSSLFYVDTGELSDGWAVEDQGPLNVGMTHVIHSQVDGNAAYAPGAMSDSDHVAVLGGEVMARGEVVGYPVAGQRFSKQLSTDAVAIRFGQHTMITSGNRLHLADSRKKTVRPLGVPKPSAEVSTLSLAPGVMGGAVSYGYRSVTRDGTHGPVRRLDPVIAETAAKVLLGSSSGVGGDNDSELGETYLQTKTTGRSCLEYASTSAAPFSTGDELPLSIHARVPDFDVDNIKELVWSRGIKSTQASDVMHFTTKQTGLSIDMSSSWTMQASFRYETPPASTKMQAQCILGVARTEGQRAGGATAPAVYNADFAAVIHDGGHTSMEADSAGYAPYGKAAPRLVCYISRQEWFASYGSSLNGLAANYQPISFTNDSTLWVAGNDYSVYFKRDGDALVVLVHDKTLGTQTTLTARSMPKLNAIAAYGPKTLTSIPPYDGSDFFSGWRSCVNTVGIIFGGGQDSMIQVPFLKESDGYADQSQYQTTFSTYSIDWTYTYGQGGGVVHYHYRFWGRAVSSNDLFHHGEERFAAQDGGTLNYDCLFDFGCLIEDISETADKMGDGLSTAVQWYALGQGRSTETFAHFEQDDTDLIDTAQPLLILGDTSTTFDNAPLSLYLSSSGNGRLVLQASGGEGTWVLTNKLWPGSLFNPTRVKQLEDFDTFVNNFNEFNWFTIALEISDPTAHASNRAFRATGLAINGNRIFDQRIGGSSTLVTAWTSPWITLGGHADNVTNAFEVEVGEFRLWDVDKGPSVENGNGFDYLAGRVPSSQLPDMLLYAKMQPSDGHLEGEGKATSAIKLYQYGSETEEMTLQNTSGRAEIYDSRTANQSGTDPAPQVSFPINPREDIVAYELCRTRVIPPVDYNNEEDRQTALDTARSLPLFLLARIPVGTTHYVDNSVDATLGESIQFEEHTVPPVALQAVIWRNQLGVVADNRRIYFSEPGPFGWETFPSALIYQARAEGSGGSEITAAQSTGTELYLFGADWTTAVIGGPGSEQEISLGNGVGSFSARCVVAVSGIVYAFNGKLWAIDRTGQADFKVVDIGQEVQDLLPTDANTRLAVSRDLSSLYVINETTGDTIRYYLPTGEVTKEKRDALALGDNSSNTGTWITLDGGYAVENGSVFGDDVESTSSTASGAGTISGDIFTASVAPTDIHVGMRVGVLDSAGDSADGRITAVAGAVVTLTSGDLTALADGAATMYYGASAEGWLLDTGYVDTQDENTLLREIYLATQAGASLEYGVSAAPVTGDRDSIADLQFAAAAENVCGAGMRGRFVRAVLRNRVPEQTKVTHIALALETKNV